MFYKSYIEILRLENVIIRYKVITQDDAKNFEM